MKKYEIQVIADNCTAVKLSKWRLITTKNGAGTKKPVPPRPGYFANWGCWNNTEK